ncbi:MAG: hypothetical protein FJ263_07865 [Planctomycetes bacterium]|nr:hypothetical protein [Planctomycetota bacterium]
MNKMHIIAKIAAGILGIYLILSAFQALIRSLSIILSSGLSSGKINTTSLVIVVTSLVMTVSFIGAVFYFLIYRGDIFARKVVGRGVELPDPPSPSAWYPFALRLAVMIAGFLFLQKAISTSSMLASYIRFAFQSNTLEGIRQVYEYGVYFLIYLAIAIYLLCGAPQFVRWQVKKTVELCKEFSEK